MLCLREQGRPESLPERARGESSSFPVISLASISSSKLTLRWLMGGSDSPCASNPWLNSNMVCMRPYET